MGKSTFTSEAELVRTGRKIISESLVPIAGAGTKSRYEVPAPGVVPDLILYNTRGRKVRYVVSIEFKLRNWRRALSQAFRHRNFGNEAYVVLDQASADVALANIDKFVGANVGLLTISRNKELNAWYLPEPRIPFSEEFSLTFAMSLLTRRCVPSSELPYIRSTLGGIELAPIRSYLEDTLHKHSA